MIHYFKRLFRIITLTLFFIPFGLNAAPITYDSLATLAQKAFLQKTHSLGVKNVSADIKSCSVLKEGQDTLLFLANFNKGFILMSTDDVAVPVLAYSVDGNFILDDVPPAVQQWLQQYKQEIAALKQQPDQPVHPDWYKLANNVVSKDNPEMVLPLTTALWNQNIYYNKYSPSDQNAPMGYDHKTPNGCVAVAMATIMYYYRYPSHGTGSHTNYTDYGNYYVNFAQQNYNYEAMEDELSGPNNEVAKLIFHCATSVDMMYGPDGSGAYSGNVPGAMQTYFGYSSSISYVDKSDFTKPQWTQLLKTELSNGRPVYYSGYNDNGGHAFVCDGYDNNNLFHFNFGWGGSSNGYYVLSASESSNAVGGFSSWQHAVVNIYPKDVNYPYYCSEKLIKSSRGTIEDGSSNLNYQDNTNCTYIITEDNLNRVDITFNYFDTQPDHDSLSFWDGNPIYGRLLRSFSGKDLSLGSYSFNTDSLYVTFKTDETETAKGWRFQYVLHSTLIPCEYVTYRTQTGTISDGSGSSDYLANSSCLWRIWPYGAQYIIITFSEMDISPEDELRICTGAGTTQEIVASLSGNQIPPPIRIDHSKVQIVFNSDNYLNAGGFTLSWVTDIQLSDVESQNMDQFSIYPNPTQSRLNVSLPQNLNDVEASVYDVTGKLMKIDANHTDNMLQMDVSSLKNGIYFLKIFGDNKVYSKKFVVNK